VVKIDGKTLSLALSWNSRQAGFEPLTVESGSTTASHDLYLPYIQQE
jgi:hypothetical protein